MACSMRRKARGPVKAQCPSVRGYQVREAGLGGLVSTGMVNGIEGFQRGNKERQLKCI